MRALIARALAVVISATSALPEIKPDPPPQARHRHRPMRTAIASWYGESGVGACALGSDVQGGYRFASLILACGARIRICHLGCATATMADRGPFVVGRTFDLNVNLRDAIGCGGICRVRWRLAR